MSYLIAAPDFMAAAAPDVAGIGSALSAANAAAALPTTGPLAAGADEVSPAVAAVFAANAQEYQALSARVADLNSTFGAAYFHDPASLAYPSDAMQLSSVTNSLGGTVTTYMVPSPTLPMLLPLKQIGVQGQIVDFLNSVLQPIVNSGYSSLTPGAGPYFSGGSLVGF